MKGTPESEADLRKRRERTIAEGPSESAIKRRLLFDAVQHPATLLPLGVFTISGIYLLLLSPVFGGELWSITLLAVSGTVATATCGWRYVSHYAEDYPTRVRALMDSRDRELAQLEEAEAAQLREDLQGGFSGIDAADGLKALNDLARQYDQLRPTISRQSDSDPISISRVSALAVETYRRGLGVLADVLELMHAAGGASRERLVGEIAQIERQVEAMKGAETQPDWTRVSEDRLASRKQRLDLVDQLQLRVDQLLFQAERCEGSLHRTRIEVAAIRTGRSETSVDSVIQALQATINQVKEVQIELKRLGY